MVFLSCIRICCYIVCIIDDFLLEKIVNEKNLLYYFFILGIGDVGFLVLLKYD